MNQLDEDGDIKKLPSAILTQSQQSTSLRQLGNLQEKDVFKSVDTNLLNDINLSEMNALGSNLGESEPRSKNNEVEKVA